MLYVFILFEMFLGRVIFIKLCKNYLKFINYYVMDFLLNIYKMFINNGWEKKIFYL